MYTPEIRIYLVTLLIAGMSLCGALGYFVFRKDRSGEGNLAFFLLMSSFVFWDILELKAITSVDIDGARFWSGWIPVAMAWTFAGLLHFSKVFPERSDASASRARVCTLAVFSLVPAALVTLGTAFSGHLRLAVSYLSIGSGQALSSNGGIVFVPWGFLTPKDIPSTLLKLVLVAYLAMAGRNLVRSYNSAPNERTRRSLRAVFAGLIAPACLGAIVLAVARIWGFVPPGHHFYPFGLFPSMFILASCCIAYAMTRYGFLNIRVIVNRMIFVTAVTFVLAGIYVVVSEMLEDIFKGWLHSDSKAAGIVAALVVAAFFTPVSSWLSNLIQEVFLGELTRFRERTAEAAGRVAMAPDLKAAADEALGFVAGLVGVRVASLRLGVQPEGVPGRVPPSVPNLDMTIKGPSAKGDCNDRHAVETASFEIPLCLGSVVCGFVKIEHDTRTDCEWITLGGQKLFTVLAARSIGGTLASGLTGNAVRGDTVSREITDRWTAALGPASIDCPGVAVIKRLGSWVPASKTFHSVHPRSGGADGFMVKWKGSWLEAAMVSCLSIGAVSDILSTGRELPLSALARSLATVLTPEGSSVTPMTILVYRLTRERSGSSESPDMGPARLETILFQPRQGEKNLSEATSKIDLLHPVQLELESGFQTSDEVPSLEVRPA